MRLVSTFVVPLALVAAAFTAVMATAVLATAVLATAVLAEEDDLPSPDEAPTVVEDLAWMSGTWRAEGAFEEHWTAPLAGSLVAVSREFDGRTTAMTELSEITMHEGSLVLRLRHFRPGLVPWESEKDGPIVWRISETGERRVVFTDPERGFPRSVTYERKDDVLTATLAGERGGEPMGMSFELKLVR